MQQLTIIKYQEDIEAVLDDRRAVWLNADQIAELLSMTKRNVLLHAANWKKSDPDAANAGMKDFFIQTPAGQRTSTHYSVDFLRYIKARTNNAQCLEIDDFHPLVAQWLDANGFTYQHEVDMPILGRADFVAMRDNVTYVIECKLKLTPSAIYQVMAYREQTGYHAIIATLEQSPNALVNQAAQLGVDVICVRGDGQ